MIYVDSEDQSVNESAYQWKTKTLMRLCIATGYSRLSLSTYVIRTFNFDLAVNLYSGLIQQKTN